MSEIEVFENPHHHRRSKKRRHYTAKQRAYGFGGRHRRYMYRAASPRPRHRRRSVVHRTYRRRHNPSLMTLGNPRHRYYRRRHNPSGRGLGRGLFRMVDLQTSLYVAGGAVAPKIALGFVRKYWSTLPSTGIGGYAVNVAAVLGLGIAVKMLMKSEARAQQFVAGGIAMLMVEAFNQYAGPALGLAGYYTTSGRRLSGYYDTMGRRLGATNPAYRLPSAGVINRLPAQAVDTRFMSN